MGKHKDDRIKWELSWRIFSRSRTVIWASTWIVLQQSPSMLAKFEIVILLPNAAQQKMKKWIRVSLRLVTQSWKEGMCNLSHGTGSSWILCEPQTHVLCQLSACHNMQFCCNLKLFCWHVCEWIHPCLLGCWPISFPILKTSTLLQCCLSLLKQFLGCFTSDSS